mmetsp:Transcript_3858/g.7098  ORF Transcript_3858/g.7098 Transcript_3858/m.7098 type:complete len:134 (-) Transcript_3858:193-594(-)
MPGSGSSLLAMGRLHGIQDLSLLLSMLPPLPLQLLFHKMVHFHGGSIGNETTGQSWNQSSIQMSRTLGLQQDLPEGFTFVISTLHSGFDNIERPYGQPSTIGTNPTHPKGGQMDVLLTDIHVHDKGTEQERIA